MSFWLQTLATLQLTLTWIRRVWLQARTRLFVPKLLRGGYDMVRAPLGYWTPLQSHNRLAGGIVYDAVEHRVVSSEAPNSFQRWQWIGAVSTSGADYGNFFADLRVERGMAAAALTPELAIQLAIHQTGLWPGPMLTVTTRMGEEISVSSITGEPPASAPSSSAEAAAEPRYPELNYIR